MCNQTSTPDYDVGAEVIPRARFILATEAQNDAANAMHAQRGWWHHLAMRDDVAYHGYCLNCMNLAMTAIYAAFGPSRLREEQP